MRNFIYESKWDESKDGKRWDEYDKIVCPNGEVVDMKKLL